MTATTLIKEDNIQPTTTSHGDGEYNYKEYSKTKEFKDIQVLEVTGIKKFKWEWTAATPNELGIYPYSKRTIRKYKFHELRASNH